MDDGADCVIIGNSGAHGDYCNCAAAVALCTTAALRAAATAADTAADAVHGSSCIPGFSVDMAHPWQSAERFAFGVNLNMILERSTTRVQRVRLYSLILC